MIHTSTLSTAYDLIQSSCISGQMFPTGEASENSQALLPGGVGDGVSAMNVQQQHLQQQQQMILMQQYMAMQTMQQQQQQQQQHDQTISAMRDLVLNQEGGIAAASGFPNAFSSAHASAMSAMGIGGFNSAGASPITDQNYAWLVRQQHQQQQQRQLSDGLVVTARHNNLVQNNSIGAPQGTPHSTAQQAAPLRTPSLSATAALGASTATRPTSTTAEGTPSLLPPYGSLTTQPPLLGLTAALDQAAAERGLDSGALAALLENPLILGLLSKHNEGDGSMVSALPMQQQLLAVASGQEQRRSSFDLTKALMEGARSRRSTAGGAASSGSIPGVIPATRGGGGAALILPPHSALSAGGTLSQGQPQVSWPHVVSMTPPGSSSASGTATPSLQAPGPLPPHLIAEFQSARTVLLQLMLSAFAFLNSEGVGAFYHALEQVSPLQCASIRPSVYFLGERKQNPGGASLISLPLIPFILLEVSVHYSTMHDLPIVQKRGRCQEMAVMRDSLLKARMGLVSS